MDKETRSIKSHFCIQMKSGILFHEINLFLSLKHCFSSLKEMVQNYLLHLEKFLFKFIDQVT